MNINKFTQNSLQAVQACEKLAYDYGNQKSRRNICYMHWLHRMTA